MTDNKASISSNNSYSQALFELATEENNVQKIENQASAIINLIHNSVDFRKLIKDPTIKMIELIKVAKIISEKNNLDKLLKRFIIFIIEKRRFFFVEKILKDFIEVCSRSRGEIYAELIAAKKLNKDEIANIKEELSSNFGSNIKLDYKHDPSLIGGLVIKVGSNMVDSSIKNKLQLIEKQMIEA